MFLVCTHCQEELANVEASSAFAASVSCGKCGNTFGQPFAPPISAEVAQPTKRPHAETKDGYFYVDGVQATREAFDAAIAQLG